MSSSVANIEMSSMKVLTLSWLPQNRRKILAAKTLIPHFLCTFICNLFIHFHAKSRTCLKRRKYFSLTFNAKITAPTKIKETV